MAFLKSSTISGNLTVTGTVTASGYYPSSGPGGGVTTGSTYPITSSWAITASYAMNGGGPGGSLSTGSLYPITASWAESASWAPGGAVAGDNFYVPVYYNNTLSTTSSIFATAQEVVIGSGSTHFDSPAVLHVWGTGSVSDVNIAEFYHISCSSYAQIKLENKSNGISSSIDIVCEANSGSEGFGYIDMGVNNGQYAVPDFNVGSALDGYLYVIGSASIGGNLSIGTNSPGKSIRFHTGGSTLSNVDMTITDNRVHITGSCISTRGFTGSLYGTASTLAQLSNNIFSRGGTLYNSSYIPNSSTYINVWRAPFNCTGSALYASATALLAAHSASVNMRKNGTTNLLSSSYGVSGSGVYFGPLTAFVANANNFLAGDFLECAFIGTTGSVSEINLQLDMVRQTT